MISSTGLVQKAVLFDFGGVLTTSVLHAFEQFGREIANDSKLPIRLLAHDPVANRALVDHEEGRLDDEGFEHQFAAALRGAGAAVEPVGLLAQMQKHLRIDPVMVALVRLVRAAGFRTALVSNSLGANCYDGVDLDSLFEVTVISGREGVRKPSSRIYEIACERLGVEIHQAVMIDDLKQNIEAARALQMHGIVHRDAASTMNELAAFIPTFPQPERNLSE